jgi:galactokinase
VAQPALPPHFILFASLLESEATDLFEFDTPLWLTRAPGAFGVIGGPGEQLGSPTFSVSIGRDVSCAIQNRRDNDIHIRILAGGPEGEDLNWSGQISDIYTKKGPPRSPAVLRSLFEETDSLWMERMMAIMIGLRRSHQLNTPKFGFSLVIWSRLPGTKAYASRTAFASGVSMAFKASTGLDKKRVDGIRLARAVTQGHQDVLGEHLRVSDALTCSLGEQQCGIFIEHGVDPVMQWIPLGENALLAAVDLGFGEIADYDTRIASATGPAMGMAYLNAGLKKEKKEGYGGWAQITPGEFEGGLRNYVPTKELGAEWLKRFAKQYPDVAEHVSPDRSYRLRALAEHAVRESGRSHRFLEQINEFARTRRDDHLMEAGKVLFSSHRSLKEKCSIRDDRIEDFVARILNTGKDTNLYGARLTGTGRDSVVVVIGHTDGEEELRDIFHKFCDDHETRGTILLETSRGAAVSGWWEGVIQPKEEEAPQEAAEAEKANSEAPSEEKEKEATSAVKE